MSHGYGDYAVENAQRLERERQAALQRCLETETALRTAAAAVASLHGKNQMGTEATGLLRQRPSTSATSLEFNTWAEQCRPVVERLEATIGRERSTRRAADLADHLKNLVASGDLAVPASLIDAAASDETEQISAKVADLTGDIAATVARLDPTATDEEMAQVTNAARSVLDVVVGSPLTRLTALKATVQLINQSAKRRRADAARADVLLRQIDGLVGSEVEQLRQLLERVCRGDTPLIGVDERAVAEVRARAIADEDRRFVAEHLAVSFLQLGYAVDVTTFTRDLTGESRAYAFVSDSDEHAVEVELRDGHYGYRLVHIDGAAPSVRDAEIELELCRDVGRVTSSALDVGIDFTLEAHTSAGVDPIRPSVRQVDRPRHRTDQVTKAREHKR